MSVLVDGASSPRWGRVEEFVELMGERVRGRPSEVVGDHESAFASAEPDGPDAIRGSPVGADVGMLDLDDEVGSAGCPVA